MSTNPTISVIIPVFNAARTLSRCLDSIIAQDFKDFEVILVDDGSTDESGKICDEYSVKDKRFIAFHKENGGVSFARNIGLSKAKGEYISFCDADDYVETNWLSVFVDGMHGHDMVVSSVNQIGNGYSTKRLFPYQVKEKDLVYAILKLEGAPGFLWNKCYRNDIIQMNKIRFNEKYKIWEDEEFVSHYMVYAKDAIMSSNVTYNYFAPDFSEKYSSSEDINAIIDIFENTKQIISLNNPLKSIYFFYVRRMLSCVRTYYYNKSYIEAYSALKRVCTIIKENGINGFSKTEKLFNVNHPMLSNIGYIVLSRLHKL